MVNKLEQWINIKLMVNKLKIMMWLHNYFV